MYGGVDAGLLIDAARAMGFMWQLSLPLTPPEYTLPEEYFTDIPVGYKKIAEYSGTEYSFTEHMFHPGFERLRTELESTGYISVSRVSHNGDRVLKLFRLNGAWFEPGETYPSPYPCLRTIKRKLQQNNLHD